MRKGPSHMCSCCCACQRALDSIVLDDRGLLVLLALLAQASGLQSIVRCNSPMQLAYLSFSFFFFRSHSLIS